MPFPFSVPTIASLDTLNLDAPVTCFVGENGSGKSTLLEALAIAANLPSAGSADRAADDPTLEQQRRLARALKLTWSARSFRGFFLRAEDFFGFQLQLIRERSGTWSRSSSVLNTSTRIVRSLRAKSRGGPMRASIADMERRYGADPDARSHGEAFLNFFSSDLIRAGCT